MKIKFKKMHGAGNDFVIMAFSEDLPNDLSAFAKSICDRHFGVGADGLMIAAPSESDDVRMIFYNADGSVAEMCGNGVRCFSRFVYEEGLVSGKCFDVETLAGTQKIELKLKDDVLIDVKVNMGKAHVIASEVPVICDKDIFENQEVDLDGQKLKLTSMRVGVPHTMVFDDDFNQKTVCHLGPKIEKHKIYPEKTNVNFVHVIDSETLRVATWERGAGATLACGTGACASFYAANKLKRVTDKVIVHVPGGILKISKNDNDEIIMEGNAVLVAEGFYYYEP
ncbi:diaminopimelate epimerase [Fusibacter sp. JL216-2]|uniref:diaminopimelate epimerase n=1 Tax=Fusibacter sp. JL216-2 TaxID=3071453 RepID=UPI003D3487C8